ncbi:endonuclease/exonuclease/phosphatase family protein [uncultured Algibacter sp.]|uniref:endonuclease/exonuclease/phosphatase family protein n=1 Tax=uncultured Algibacter sp. TaxID=298659 RepID=UPI00260E1D8A|nr:endonuclease/exonuclease/phosphatase family protein [uncultured Algibacter sp.]
MMKYKTSKKVSGRSKISMLLTYISSILLMVGCIICNFKLNFFAFLFSLIAPILLIINTLFMFYWFIKHRGYSYFPLLSLFIYFIFFSSPLQFNGKRDVNKENVFSFMTFNSRAFGASHNVRNSVNSEKIIDFVKNEYPDIISFQEFSKFELKSFPLYPYQFIGYRPNFEKSLQVIYSKYPIVSKGYVDFPNTRNLAIYSDINIKNEIVRVYNIHLQSYLLKISKSNFNPQGVNMLVNKVNTAQSKQEKQVQIILNHAKTFKGKVIFAGDFNSTQYSKNYNYLKNNKKDSFIEAGFGLGVTYPLFNYPFRIDFILVDNDIEVLSHQNFNLKLSDHEPILARLAVN